MYLLIVSAGGDNDMDSVKFEGMGEEKLRFTDLNTEKASVLNFSFMIQKPQKRPRHSEHTYFQMG